MSKIAFVALLSASVAAFSAQQSIAQQSAVYDTERQRAPDLSDLQASAVPRAAVDRLGLCMTSVDDSIALVIGHIWVCKDNKVTTPDGEDVTWESRKPVTFACGSPEEPCTCYGC